MAQPQTLENLRTGLRETLELVSTLANTVWSGKKTDLCKALQNCIQYYQDIQANIRAAPPATIKAGEPPSKYNTLCAVLDDVLYLLERIKGILEQKSKGKGGFFNSNDPKEIAELLPGLESSLGKLAELLELKANYAFDAPKCIAHKESVQFWKARFGDKTFEVKVADLLHALDAAKIPIQDGQKKALCLFSWVNVYEFDDSTSQFGLTQSMRAKQPNSAPFSAANPMCVYPTRSEYMFRHTPKPAGQGPDSALGRVVNWNAKPKNRPEAKHFWIYTTFKGATLALDLNDFDKYGITPGIQVVAAPIKDVPTQKWRVDKQGRIRHVVSNLALDVSGKIDKSSPLMIWTSRNAASQRWMLTHEGRLTHASPARLHEKNPQTGAESDNLLAVNLEEQKLSNGNQLVILWPKRPGEKQTWRFSYTAAPATTPTVTQELI
jgi:hypothetical protein